MIGTHHWHEDASRTSVERTLDMPACTGADIRRRDAYERAWRVAPDSGNHLDGLCRARLERGESVFTIDHDPREVLTRLRDHSGVGHAWQGDPRSKGAHTSACCLERTFESK